VKARRPICVNAAVPSPLWHQLASKGDAVQFGYSQTAEQLIVHVTQPRKAAKFFLNCYLLARIYRFTGLFFYRGHLAADESEGGCSMKDPDKYRENAANCALLAQQAKHGPARIRYKRTETAWLSLADEQDWLDGEVPPDKMTNDCDTGKMPPR
jgi:hypothetical protein